MITLHSDVSLAVTVRYASLIGCYFWMSSCRKAKDIWLRLLSFYGYGEIIERLKVLRYAPEGLGLTRYAIQLKNQTRARWFNEGVVYYMELPPVETIPL